MNSNRNKGVIIMGTQEKNDTNNNGTPGSNKKTQLISPELKEVTEILSDIFPVLGAVYAIALVLFQNKYCQDAENFYKIDSIHFLTDNIQKLLLPLLLLNIIYLIFIFYFKCDLRKGRKINKDYVPNCLINIIASGMFMVGVHLSSLPFYLEVILFFLASVILIMECIFLIVYFLKKLSKVKDCIQNDLFTDIRDFLCLIFLVLAGVFTFLSVIDNNRFFQNKKYEIIYDVNTDFNSNKLDVEVVILHKGSQIITKKGKIVDNTLYIDKCSYEIKEFSQYKYILRGFTMVDNNQTLQKKYYCRRG